MTRPLWEATRDQHHACEEHLVGAAMASGKPPMDWYSDWLYAIHRIHHKIDPTLPVVLHRTARLEDDITEVGRISTPVPAAYAYAESLDTDDKIAGAAYVLTGAHLMGGEIMRRRLDGYPTSHLVWDDRKAALEELKAYRVRSELAAEARDCFTALLRIMDEIKERTDGRT